MAETRKAPRKPRGSRQPATPAADAQPAPAAAVERRPFKRIFLFSDGTGNSSAKLFKTNVWQMYQAVDLGPAETAADGSEEVVQIAYYNNGVGTSSFRPLAVLGGVFGFGLKANVLSLYEFLCRNYQPGDEILAFGFSRGAFTIRLLIELISTQGVIRYNDEQDFLTEEDLSRQSAEAFRRMHAEWQLNARLANLALKAIRGVMKAIRHPKPLKVWPKQETKITFVGLWDTVAAYGGPISEITRAIDDWIWPLTMPDYRLSSQVGKARHALALDDARDSFWPLLWDETAEQPPADGEEPRLKQVWFTGMHADVGGGYPDDSLSYVSLTWMIEELAGGARLIDTAVKRAYDLSNDFGPMHDSRYGAAGYYRYQPRRVAAMLDPVDPKTLSLRDPNIQRVVGRRREPQGLIHDVHVHESVLRRMLSGTDGYGPLALPRKFTIVRRKESTPHAERLPRLPSQLQEDLDKLAAEAAALEPKGAGDQKIDPLDLLWDRVWRRRGVYFITVLFSIALATGALWPNECPDARCAMSDPIALLKGVLPGFAEPWVDGWRAHPIIALALATAIFVSMSIGAGIEGRLRDAVRKIWIHATARISDATDEGRHELTGAAKAQLDPVPKLRAVEPTTLSRIRTAYVYQRAVQLLKWRWTPMILGPVMILTMAALVIMAGTQFRIALEEETDAYCPSIAGAPVQPVMFSSASMCNRTGVRLTKGVAYQIWLTDRQGVWMYAGPFGKGTNASPAGVYHAGLLMRLAAPWRRVMTAPYLATMALVEGPRNSWNYGPVFVLDLHMSCARSGDCLGEFTSPIDGDLSLFSNDAVPLVGPSDLFYTNNKGRAKVTVTIKP